MGKILETFGYILKSENFTVLKSKVLKGTTVLENIEPFPGYHSENVPTTDTKPGHLFFFIQSKYQWEDLTRRIHKIGKYFNSDFEMNHAFIFERNQIYESLRIKGLDSYDSIESLQRCFLSEDINIVKNKKMSLRAVTKVKKYFILKQVSDHIYHDEEEENIHYLDISYSFTWEFFRKMTKLVKSNLEGFDFDAAICVLYRKSGLIDCIRVYGKHNVEELDKIRLKYIELIEKYS